MTKHTGMYPSTLLSLKGLFYLTLIGLLLISCERFEGSPFEVTESEPRYNDVNTARIASLPKKDTIVFAFIGDTQRFYDDVRDAVNAINKEQIDFTIISGDITDFGLKEEYDLMIDILNDLDQPYVASIGNHDMIAQGRKNFKRYFGDEHVSFQASKFKFVLHNTNSVAMGFDRSLPDINWLRETFEATPNDVQLISLSHVPRSIPISTQHYQNLTTTC